MADYSKKTVADLTEVLKSRGLPHSGKKAELIARLTEDDNKVETKPVEETPAVAEPEPQSEPAVEPAETIESTTSIQQEEGPVAPEAPAEPSISYALNLPTSNLDSELAKRKARAERFGTGATQTTNGTDAAAESTPQADSTSESLKALERAKRFGAAETSAPTAVSKLDEALPSDGPRGRGSKRKAEESSSLDDQGLKKSFAGRGRGQGQGRGGRVAHGQRGGERNGSRPQGVTKGPAYSDKDKAAAEARKKKFATA